MTRVPTANGEDWRGRKPAPSPLFTPIGSPAGSFFATDDAYGGLLAAAAERRRDGLRAALLVLLGLCGVAGLAATIALRVAIGLGGCSFDFGERDFEKFKRTEAICDLGFAKLTVLTTAASVVTTLALVGMGVTALKNHCLLLVFLATQGVVLLMAAALVIAALASGFPFVRYGVAMVVALVMEVLVLALGLALRPLYHRQDALYHERRRAVESQAAAEEAAAAAEAAEAAAVAAAAAAVGPVEAHAAVEMVQQGAPPPS